ncbi:MAG: TRAP transporter large permease [Planctomycetota bacterium]|nr:TRAP transporter large permease [Planctomycetota bacterium]
MVSFVVCVLLIGLMILGVPIAASMGITSAGIFAALGQGQYLAVMPQRIFIGATGLTMLAIPFFILAGNLMNTGGITDRIFTFARAICGHWPGGLGQVNIFSSVIFSGMSGAAVADAAGLGAIEMKAMTDAGFDKKFSAGITAASSTIGPVIPPSIPFVVYASITGTSVGKLFMAGFIPGILMAVAMSISVYITSKRRNYPVDPKAIFSVRFRSFIRAVPSLFTVVLIIGGIWGGYFTPTEAAVVATLYAFILGAVVYRELGLKDVLNVLKQSMLQSCKTLFIIAVANFLAYFLTHQRIPNQIITGMTAMTTNPHLQMLIIIFVLLILGCFIEGVAVILIATPIFMPVVNAMGMDPVQFGVVMILASMIGLLTPPVGMSLYAVSSICDVDVVSLSKAVLPYLLGILIILLVATFWPPLSMVVPNWLA